MTHVTLYGKPDCHLCDDAEQLLARLQRTHPHVLDKVDITTLPTEQFERYRYRIPVLSMGEREIAAPLDRKAVEAFLKAGATHAS